METNRQLDTSPCDICKNWLDAKEICPDITNWIPEIRGKMCSQGVLHREFCSLSTTTRFEPNSDITEDVLKDRLSEDAYEAVLMGISEKRHSDHLLHVRFERF